MRQTLPLILCVGTFISILPWLGCTSPKNTTTNAELTGIDFITKMEPLTSLGDIMRFDDTLQVYYYKELVLYKIPYDFIDASAKGTIDPKTDILNVDDSTAIVQYDDFIIKTGDSIGIFYSHRGHFMPVKKLHKDTALYTKSPQPWLFQIAHNPNDTLIKSKTVGNALIETYRPKEKLDETYPDTTYLYYSHDFKQFGLSLSPQMDSIKKLRLFKIRLVYNEIKTGNYPKPIPPREFLFEIRPKQIADRDSILELFNKYNQDNTGLLR